MLISNVEATKNRIEMLSRNVSWEGVAQVEATIDGMQQKLALSNQHWVDYLGSLGSVQSLQGASQTGKTQLRQLAAKISELRASLSRLTPVASSQPARSSKMPSSSALQSVLVHS